MPIPFLLAGAALVAGAIGIKKGVDAYDDNQEAQQIYKKAEKAFNSTKMEMEETKELAASALTELGKLKLEIWNRQFGRFISLVNKVKNVELTGHAAVDGAVNCNISREELNQMRDMSLKANEVITGGVQAVSAGALAGIASYGGAMMFASASTGTAISTLSGVAASNATLAWFGGGSLAAGGLGMAGGAVVLGGLVAGPLIAVGGMFMASKARENLAEAKKVQAEVKVAVQEMKNASSLLEAIKKISNQFTEAINEMDKRMSLVLNNLECNLVSAEKEREESFVFKLKRFWFGIFSKTVPLDYHKLNDIQKSSIYLAYQFAQATKILLETPLLNRDGGLDKDCLKALEPSRKLLEAGN